MEPRIRASEIAPVIAVLTLALLAAAVHLSAASLGGSTPARLGAAGATVPRCDANGVSVTYVVSSGTVTQATVSDIASTCVGGSMAITLANAAGASIGAGSAQPVAGSSLTFALSPQPTASAVASVHVSITGP